MLGFAAALAAAVALLNWGSSRRAWCPRNLATCPWPPSRRPPTARAPSPLAGSVAGEVGAGEVERRVSRTVLKPNPGDPKFDDAGADAGDGGGAAPPNPRDPKFDDAGADAGDGGGAATPNPGDPKFDDAGADAGDAGDTSDADDAGIHLGLVGAVMGAVEAGALETAELLNQATATAKTRSTVISWRCRRQRRPSIGPLGVRRV